MVVDTRMRKIATIAEVPYIKFDALLRNCDACRCKFWYDESGDVAKFQGTKEDCDDLMFWARLKK